MKAAMSHHRYPSSDNELMLYRVLQHANLVQYYEAFVSQGGDDVNQLCEAGEEEFLEIMALVGMASKPLHVRRLQKALLEWIMEPAKFCKPMQDRRVSPALVSKGSIYAAVQQDPSLRVVNGNRTTPADTAPHLPPSVDGRAVQPASVNHRVTPTSDDTSDHDAASNTSFDVGVGMGSQLMRSSDVSPLTFNSSSPALLSDEHIAVIAASAISMAKTLPPYAPKPLNSKRQLDKEIQDAMACLEEDPNRLDVSRRYSAIYGRFDSKRPPHKQMNFHEICVNEAAAHLCRYRPSLLTRRDDLYNLALRIVKETGFQPLRPVPSTFPYSAISTQTSSSAPPVKQPRLESPSMSSSNNTPKPAQSSLLNTEEQDSLNDTGCSVMDASSDDPVPLDSEPPSLVDEGLRIARQYGLGADFESELEGLKKATSAAAAAAHEGERAAEGTEGSTALDSAWNNGAGIADLGAGIVDQTTGTVDVDQAKMAT